MQLVRYAGWEPVNRPKKYKVKPVRPRKPQVPSTFVIPKEIILTKFDHSQTRDLPPMPDSLKKILLEVCLAHRIVPNDLVGKRRNKVLIAARQAFIRRVRSETDASFPRIAKLLNRDHTTIIHSYYGGKRTRAARKALESGDE